MELLDLGIALAGLALVLFGAALSVYATALLGVLIGAAGGYVLAPQLLGVVGAGGVVGLAAAVAAGGVPGGGLAPALIHILRRRRALAMLRLWRARSTYEL